MTSDATAMDKRSDTSFSRKRSSTFGAYGSMDRSCEDQSRPESMGATLMDILDSPSIEPTPVLSSSSNQKESELFEFIAKLQGSRIDEQRCHFPLPLKSQLLTLGRELPLILPSKAGGFWIDPPSERQSDLSPTSSTHGADQESYDILERDGEAKIYHDVFRSRYHHSFTAVDPCLGSLVLSVCLEEDENRIRVILRMKECSLHGVFSLSLFPNIPSTVELAKMLCDKVTVPKFDAVCYLKAPDLIQTFDEHRVSPNFKFGVLYQKDKQLTEEEILSNNEESDEFKEFLSILGETIQLQGFTGFRGGLDVCHGQTGSEAVYTSFHGREIMFHVTTKLPFTDCDPQQLQRKRHIGNDIVALVYQEGHTPFLPDVIKSHFLHSFLVVRRLANSDEGSGYAYQVSVTARDDVPNFCPVLPDPPVFRDRSLLREFLLTKLINAEISCYKAEQFSKLELRTRSSLLETLRTELFTRSQCMMGDPTLSAQLSQTEGIRTASEGTGGFIENFKRAIRVRSHSFETLGVPRKTGTSSQKHKTEKDSESDRSSASLSTNSDGVGPEIKDHPSPQEET
ncbi:rap1 GTPase-activating protein 2 isoform X2 [Boleophthalmus pectinirostris]|uniref:rap1 GTPase-activating protein 2 isoform X2 n=1 Tax=Boleophthalmus pectinirostris TaxID=150288 RepID=UPI00242EA1FA|nr:rap1 GTPase-activating protein 2 isoform X2 [Boleophthalmus pectinirostris]